MRDDDNNAHRLPSGGEGVDRPAGAAPPMDPAVAEGLHAVVTASSAVVAVGAPDGRLTYMNPAALTFFGIAVDGLGARSIASLYPPWAYQDVMAEGFPAALRAGVWSGETALLDHRGREVPFLQELHVQRGPDGEPKTVAIVCHDISRQKEAEGGLRDAEARFRAVFERAHTGIGLLSRDGRCQMANSKLADILGRRVEELCNQPLLDHVHPDHRARCEAYLRELVTGRIDTDRAEIPFIRKDGTPVTVASSCSLMRDADGRPQCLVGMFDDVSDRERLEQSMESYADRLELLHEIDQSILAADSVASIAQTVLDRLREFIPCDVSNVVAFDFERDEFRMLAHTMPLSTDVSPDQGQPLSEFGIPPQLHWGEVFKLDDLDTDPVDFPPGAILRLRRREIRSFVNAPLLVREELIGSLNLASTEPGFFQDEHVALATQVADELALALHQARLQEDLQRYAEELEQRVAARTVELKDRNDELESFSYSVSHDLRAPLKGMRTFAEEVLEDYDEDLPDRAHECVSRIVQSARRMDDLILDLLAYSRLGRTRMELEEVALDAAVSDVIENLDGVIRERDADVRVEGSFPAILAHPATLFQAVENLVTNALKFVAPGVRPRVAVRAEVHGSLARLWVEDNGIGIPEDRRERVFQVFERLHGDREYAGTGIGLAVVKKGVERMGGAVGFESAQGGGTRFWLEFQRPGG